MLKLTAESRAFFHAEVGEIEGKKLPAAQLGDAICGIMDHAVALKFLAGHIHWLRGIKPRTVAVSLETAAFNLLYDYDRLSEAQAEMWIDVFEDASRTKEDDPEYAFSKSKSAAKRIAAGQDPLKVAKLAAKIVKKKEA